MESITRSEASGESLARTTEALQEIIRHAREYHEKSICFVTGVPGAGKTLVGLNLAVRQLDDREQAVYLSGNFPLVKVLIEALARDSKWQEQELHPERRALIEDARRKVRAFIQLIHHYRKAMLDKVERPIRKALRIDPARTARHATDGGAEVEHVAIFDEAQRAWTQKKLSSWLAQKHDLRDFPMSEPEFLIWSLDLHKDWAGSSASWAKGRKSAMARPALGNGCAPWPAVFPIGASLPPTAWAASPTWRRRAPS